ncbi:hypothetical protein MOO45_00565 [Bombilactobacillus folatiphilus]|uniref:Uncharacterized protein n=1 Tax=Bombilactobacillus folatiphilus TaxID=2923362 RepID=A0ABY4P9C4_9LACO|nr:hypothetical protein [Bombilactobacillus folatiphilus]UQS82222.1 hypothetical protein MOO45_00565 [Bombilactobacillus folatiphilus]
MEITTKQFQDKIQNQDYQSFTQTVKMTKSLAQSKIAAAVQTSCEQLSEACDSGYLAQGILDFQGLNFPVTCSIQMSLINLPWVDSAKVSHFLDADEKRTLHAYLVTDCEWINVSHLRIDEVAQDPSNLMDCQQSIVEMITANLKQAMDNQEQAAQASEDQK